MDRTVIVDQYRAKASIPATDNAYKGLRIHALAGLHEFIGERIIEFFPPAAEVVDLAAGSGAMCLRLRDMGLKPRAIDYVPENFGVPGIEFTQADLNEDFSKLFTTQFTGAIASEIIEHLENPRHFAREIFRILKPGGRLILSTPNIDSPGSLAMFVRSGRFHWFSDDDYKTQGHITPLSQWQIGKCFAEAGFRFLWKGSYGKGASHLEGSPRLSVLSSLLSWISTADANLRGEIFVCVLEKP